MNRFFGRFLIVIGVLIAGTAGLCRAAILAPAGRSDPDANIYVDWGATVALVGGISLIIGLACIFVGIAVIRRGK